MSNKFSFRPVAAGTLVFALLAAHPAGAQAPTTLSLSAPVTTAIKNQSVTFTVLMNGGNNTGGYDFFVNLNPTYLSFGSAGFVFNSAAGFTAGAPFTYSAINGGQMEVSSATPAGTTLGPQTATALGTFTISVNSVPATATVTQITFSTIGFGAGQSYVVTGANTNELSSTTPASLTLTPAAAPEPSQTAAFGLGVLGLAGLVLRARRAKSAC